MIGVNLHHVATIQFTHTHTHTSQLSSIRLLSLRLSLTLMMLACQSGRESLAFVLLVLKSI